MATWLERLTSSLHLLPNAARRIFLVRSQSKPKSQVKHLANAGQKNHAAQLGDVDRDKNKQSFTAAFRLLLIHLDSRQLGSQSGIGDAAL